MSLPLEQPDTCTGATLGLLYPKDPPVLKSLRVVNLLRGVNSLQ